MDIKEGLEKSFRYEATHRVLLLSRLEYVTSSTYFSGLIFENAPAEPLFR